MSRLVFVWCLLLSGSAISNAIGAEKSSKVNWQPWSTAAFEQAAAEGKLLLLEMEAVWCHWCHVMDDKTYSRQDVADAIHASYVPMRVDHDARPDLANRYRDWGWPATIILKPDGTELVKRAGYIAPQPFLDLLAAVVADPTPEAAARLVPQPEVADSSLSATVKEKLLARHIQSSDLEIGGLRTAQKFIDAGALEFALAQAANPNLAPAQRALETDIARSTLDGGLNLIDPAWGGAYQYSTGGNWQTPHYEKLMFTQARYLRLYGLSAELFAEPRYAQAAESIVRYLKSFMRDPRGAFYTSQDADLIPGQKSSAYFALNNEARRRQGIPKVDQNIYARENGLVAEALLRWYQYSGNAEGLALARTSIKAVIKTHGLENGGFGHSAGDQKLYLEDHLAMAAALLALYEVTGERQWLARSIRTAEVIDDNFRHSTVGWIDAPDIGPLAPQPGIDQNINVGRFLNRLFHFTGQSRWRTAAEFAMQFLAAERVALSRIEETGLLLFDTELNVPPLHYAIVGSKDNTLAKQQFDSALRDPVAYKRVEWWDRSEGPLQHDDVPYPNFPMTAAYVCTDKRCSAPAFDMENWNRRRQGLIRYP